MQNNLPPVRVCVWKERGFARWQNEATNNSGLHTHPGEKQPRQDQKNPGRKRHGWLLERNWLALGKRLNFIGCSLWYNVQLLYSHLYTHCPSLHVYPWVHIPVHSVHRLYVRTSLYEGGREGRGDVTEKHRSFALTCYSQWNNPRSKCEVHSFSKIEKLIFKFVVKGWGNILQSN